jgi:hypothetical protein
VSLDTLPQAVQDYIKELREKDASARVELNKFKLLQKKQEEAAAEAAAQRLKEQGEFKQLAEQHEVRVKELEPVAQRYADLSLQVSLQIEAQIKDWPAEVKAFDPGNDAPVEDRLAWIEKSRPLVDRLTQQAARPGNHNPVKPAVGEPTSEQQVNQKMNQLRASRKYF